MSERKIPFLAKVRFKVGGMASSVGTTYQLGLVIVWVLVLMQVISQLKVSLASFSSMNGKTDNCVSTKKLYKRNKQNFLDG